MVQVAGCQHHTRDNLRSSFWPKVFGSLWLLHNRMHSWLFVRILPTAAVTMVLGLGVQRASVLSDFFKVDEVPNISSILNLNIRLRLIKFNIDNKYCIYCTYCTYDPEVSICMNCTILHNLVDYCNVPSPVHTW
jgi:hypothetical protein